MNHDHNDLDDALRRLKQAGAELHAPAPSAALLQAFDKRHRPGRLRRIMNLLPQIKPYAGTMAMLFAVGLAALAPNTALRAPHSAAVAASASPQDDGRPFIALTTADDIAAQGHLTLVEKQVSGLDLANMGMLVGPESISASVQTQMLVNDEGQTVAFRLMD